MSILKDINKKITLLTDGINKNLRDQEKIDDGKKAIFLKEINDVEGQISNIVNAISQGFV